jgi:hypothetical protein
MEIPQVSLWPPQTGFSLMSDFSESYHLRTERTDDAIELLKGLGRKGFVFEPANGWVTFVVDGGNFEPDQQIVAKARQPLLHFVSAEDHGCGFWLFDQGKVVSAYACEWENDITVDDAKYSRQALERLVPSADGPSLDEFERRMRPEDIEELFGANPSRVFAQAVGLEHFEWVSYDYIATDGPDEHGAIEVA